MVRITGRMVSLTLSTALIPHSLLGRLLGWAGLGWAEVACHEWAQALGDQRQALPLSASLPILWFQTKWLPRNWAMSLCPRRHGFCFFIHKEIMKGSNVDRKQSEEGASPGWRKYKAEWEPAETPHRCTILKRLKNDSVSPCRSQGCASTPACLLLCVTGANPAGCASESPVAAASAGFSHAGRGQWGRRRGEAGVSVLPSALFDLHVGIF